MNQQSQPQPCELCPHLAAAVLWMSKTSGTKRPGKSKIRYARPFGHATDDQLAL